MDFVANPELMSFTMKARAHSMAIEIQEQEELLRAIALSNMARTQPFKFETSKRDEWRKKFGLDDGATTNAAAAAVDVPVAAPVCLPWETKATPSLDSIGAMGISAGGSSDGASACSGVGGGAGRGAGHPVGELHGRDVTLLAEGDTEEWGSPCTMNFAINPRLCHTT
jgi:hypothetical protein